MKSARFSVGSSSPWSGNEAVKALLDRFYDLSERVSRISSSFNRLENLTNRLGEAYNRMIAGFMIMVGFPRILRGDVHHALLGGHKRPDGGKSSGGAGGGGSGGGSGGEGGFPGWDVVKKDYSDYIDHRIKEDDRYAASKKRDTSPEGGGGFPGWEKVKSDYSDFINHKIKEQRRLQAEIAKIHGKVKVRPKIKAAIAEELKKVSVAEEVAAEFQGPMPRPEEPLPGNRKRQPGEDLGRTQFEALRNEIRLKASRYKQAPEADQPAILEELKKLIAQRKALAPRYATPDLAEGTKLFEAAKAASEEHSKLKDRVDVFQGLQEDPNFVDPRNLNPNRIEKAKEALAQQASVVSNAINAAKMWIRNALKSKNLSGSQIDELKVQQEQIEDLSGTFGAISKGVRSQSSPYAAFTGPTYNYPDIKVGTVAPQLGTVGQAVKSIVGKGLGRDPLKKYAHLVGLLDFLKLKGQGLYSVVKNTSKTAYGGAKHGVNAIYDILKVSARGLATGFKATYGRAKPGVEALYDELKVSAQELATGFKATTAKITKAADGLSQIFLGVAAAASGLVRAASPDLMSTLSLSLQLLAAEIGQHLLPFFVQLTAGVQKVTRVFEQYPTLGKHFASLVKGVLLFTGSLIAASVTVKATSVLFSKTGALAIAFSALAIVVSSVADTMSKLNQRDKELALTKAHRITTEDLGHPLLQALGPQKGEEGTGRALARLKLMEEQLDTNIKAAEIISAKSEGLVGTPQKDIFVGMLSQRLGLNAENMKKWTDLINIGAKEALKDLYADRGIASDNKTYSQESHDNYKRWLGEKNLISQYRQVLEGKLTPVAASPESQENATKQLLFHISSQKVQPRFQAVEEAYRNIQIEAISKSPMEALLEQKVTKNLYTVIELLGKIAGLNEQQIKSIQYGVVPTGQ